MKRRRPELEGWQSMHGVAENGAIESDERVLALHHVVAMTDDGARELGERYWLEVRRASFGLLRLEPTPLGSELRLHPIGVRLLRFDPPQVSCGAEGVTCSYRIRGGVLARYGAGALVLSHSNDERPELRAAVTGFLPRFGPRPGYPSWTGWLYEWCQRRAHVAISRRFFGSLLQGARS
jgi:hypothetical protein